MLWSVVLVACLASTTLAQRGQRFQRQGKKDCEADTCLLLKDCPPVLTMIENAKGNNNLQSHLRSLICGFEDDHAKVCCPVNHIDENIGDVSVLPSEPNCGLSGDIDFEKIIGGNPSTLGQWPWIVALGYREKRGDLNKISWLCGGTLITPSHVLTAAHCLTNPKYVLEKVRLGDLDLNDSIEDGATPIERFIEKKIPHEAYSDTFNDIAILKLDKPVTYTNLIQPICLPTRPELRMEQFERKTPFAIGWGSIQFRGPSATHLQYVQFPVVSNEVCDQVFQAHNQSIISSQICAGDLKGGKDTCTGDSGGPLMIPYNGQHFYHIGVVSFGYKCGEVGYPGVYTRTTEYIDWISDKIKM